MGCYMSFITTMCLSLIYHFMLVEGLVISDLSDSVYRHILEEFNGVLLQAYVWDNVDITVTTCHVFQSFLHSR